MSLDPPMPQAMISLGVLILLLGWKACRCPDPGFQGSGCRDRSGVQVAGSGRARSRVSAVSKAWVHGQPAGRRSRTRRAWRVRCAGTAR